MLGESQGEQIQEDIPTPPKLDTPSPGSKVIDALEEDKSSPAHDEADELQLIKTVEHDASQSMQGLVEEQQKAIESECQVKSEIEAAKGKEPKLPPIKITFPRKKSVIVRPPAPAKQPSSEDDEDTEDDDDVPLQALRSHKKN